LLSGRRLSDEEARLLQEFKLESSQ
jgi:hypothetical protein